MATLTESLIIGGILVIAVGATGFLAGKKVEGAVKDFGTALGFNNPDIKKAAGSISGVVTGTAKGINSVGGGLTTVGNAGQSIFGAVDEFVNKERPTFGTGLQDAASQDFNQLKEFFGGATSLVGGAFNTVTGAFNTGSNIGPVQAGNTPAILGLKGQDIFSGQSDLEAFGE